MSFCQNLPDVFPIRDFRADARNDNTEITQQLNIRDDNTGYR